MSNGNGATTCTQLCLKIDISQIRVQKFNNSVQEFKHQISIFVYSLLNNSNVFSTNREFAFFLNKFMFTSYEQIYLCIMKSHYLNESHAY